MPEQPRRSYKELSLPQLRNFCEVCKRGGYAAAARILHLTSPAVWEQMQGLERHFGVALLERHGAGVRPTLHGERLLEMLRPILAELESVREVLQQEEGVVPAQLTLVTNLRVLVEEISHGMRRFQQRYPAVRLRVFYTGSDEVEPRVLSGDADVAVTLEPGPEERRSTTTSYEPAGELDYLLIAPPRHPLLRRRALSLPGIVQHPLVLGETGAYSRRRVQEVLHRHELAHQAAIAVETSSDEYTLACVRAGMGVGITVGLPRGHLYAGLAVRSLRRWFGTARVGFQWQRNAHVPPVQRALADAIRLSLAEGRRGGRR